MHDPRTVAFAGQSTHPNRRFFPVFKQASVGDDPLSLQLLVVDSDVCEHLVDGWLNSSGMAKCARISRASTLEEALAHLSTRDHDLILLDVDQRKNDCLEEFRTLKQAVPDVPIVLMGDEFTEETASAAVREGAQECVLKNSQQQNPLVHSLRLGLARHKSQQLEVMLRNADEQLAVAQLVQEHLYPEAPPAIPGFDIAGHCIAGEGIAGDYFDYLSMRNMTGIVVGDVMGHGYDAALVMAGVRGVLRALAHTYSDVADLLYRANQVLAPDLAERFVTVLFAAIDPKGPAVHYAAAGHAGFVIDCNGNVKERLKATAPPLGVGDPATLTSACVPLALGDILLIYTDGISESCSATGELLGDGGVIQLLQDSRHLPARQIVEQLLSTAREFSGRQLQLDDMTAVVVKYDGDGCEHSQQTSQRE